MDKKLIMAQTSGGLDIFYKLIPDMPPHTSKDRKFFSVFRDEKTKSAEVFKKKAGPNKGDYHYKDFGSADSLNAIEFIQKLFGCSWKEACEKALDFANLSTPLLVKEPAFPQVVVFPAKGLTDRVLKDCSSNLHEAFRKLVPDSHSKAWGVGTWPIEKVNYTAFVYQNVEKVAVNIKWLEYQQDGKRRKIISPKSLAGKKKSGPQGDYVEVYEICLFGEHLLSGKPVCVVESEKTAWLVSFFYPQFDWIATGGQSRMDEAAVLRTGLNDGRQVIVLCDADPIRKIPQAYKILKEMGANVGLLDLMPNRSDKSDMADFVIEGLRPDIIFPETEPQWASGRSEKIQAIIDSASAPDPVNDEGKIVRFWSQEKKIELVPSLFIRFLEQENYRKIITPDGQAQYIRIDGKFIDETFPLNIKDFVEEYLKKPDFGTRPLDHVIKNTQYFKTDYLSSISTTVPKIQEDTLNDSYVYYENCAVHINESGIEAIPYESLDGLVWRSRVIKRPYKKIDSTGCVFERFLRLSTGGNPVAFDSLRSILGFMLHTHKNSATNRVVIFNDEVISEKAKGGSGKGIVCESVSHIRESVMIDGKTHDMQSAFPFQLVKKSTQFVMFDDVEKTFNFSKLFSVVTGGITLEYKNKGAFRLPVEESPNMAICTNYALSGDDDSNNRRRLEIELSSYFTEHHTPFKEFGHFLFSEWDKNEWLRFDNFMMECLLLYFQNGCLPYPFKNLDYKKFIKATSTEFAEWVEDYPIELNTPFRTTEKLAEFLKLYPEQTKYMGIKRFAGCLETHAAKIGCNYTEVRAPSGRFRVFVPVIAHEPAVFEPVNDIIDFDPLEVPF